MHRPVQDRPVEFDRTEQWLMHDQLLDDHEAQRVLCLELEQLADMLPALPPTTRIRRICAQIEGVTSIHFRRAEVVLSALSATLADSVGDGLLRTLAEIQEIDAVHGQDLIGVLWDGAARGGVSSPDQLGYMLRCFFDGCRRSIAFKETMLLVFDRSGPTRAQPH
jgi:hypothetical protein